MCKSTIGFSDMVEGNDHSKIIQAKNDYFLKNSLVGRLLLLSRDISIEIT